jgi:hypothetical protein
MDINGVDGRDLLLLGVLLILLGLGSLLGPARAPRHTGDPTTPTPASKDHPP